MRRVRPRLHSQGQVRCPYEGMLRCSEETKIEQLTLGDFHIRNYLWCRQGWEFDFVITVLLEGLQEPPLVEFLFSSVGLGELVAWSVFFLMSLAFILRCLDLAWVGRGLPGWQFRWDGRNCFYTVSPLSFALHCVHCIEGNWTALGRFCCFIGDSVVSGFRHCI